LVPKEEGAVKETPSDPSGDGQNSDLYLNAVGALLSLHRYLRRSSKATSESGISGKQHATLRALESGPLTMRGLAKILFSGESATSELVAKLEERGFAQRQRSKDDNRVVLVSITRTGRQVADDTPLAGLPLLRERLRTLNEAELRHIQTAVQQVLDLLEVESER
jgi:MarR family transcriptional regulator, organic hydroperoxide resistance regulator